MSLKLLSTGNPKLMKGEKQGYLSFILHLAPSILSGFNTCPMASAGCASACLNTAGRGGLFKKGETTNAIQEARIRKTRQFFTDRDTFMAQLVKDITLAIKQADRKNMIPVFRLNGTSDIAWATVPATINGVTFPNLMLAFPTVQFYDYSKRENLRDLPANYHITLSRSETNESRIANLPYNIAVVFRGTLPETYLGRAVINGDTTDLRFLDPTGVVVGLVAKGKGKRDTSGFVV